MNKKTVITDPDFFLLIIKIRKVKRYWYSHGCHLFWSSRHDSNSVIKHIITIFWLSGLSIKMNKHIITVTNKKVCIHPGIDDKIVNGGTTGNIRSETHNLKLIILASSQNTAVTLIMKPAGLIPDFGERENIFIRNKYN